MGSTVRGPSALTEEYHEKRGEPSHLTEQLLTSITKQYPALSSIILNAGIQRTLDFTNPSYDELSSKITSEIDTNYTSPLLTITAFLPHLISLGASSTAASVILVTSGLALVPIARCANYCSTKSALHHFGLSLRSQMQSSPATRHVRVIVSLSIHVPSLYICFLQVSTVGWVC